MAFSTNPCPLLFHQHSDDIQENPHWPETCSRLEDTKQIYQKIKLTGLLMNFYILQMAGYQIFSLFSSDNQIYSAKTPPHKHIQYNQPLA